MHALDGIHYVLKSQRNMKIHVTIALGILALSMFLNIPKAHFIWVMFAIFFVMCMETLNTAIERTVDLITADYHPLAKLAKDISAGVVLFASLFAMLTGIVVFTEPILQLFEITFLLPMELVIPLIMVCFILSIFIKRPIWSIVFFISFSIIGLFVMYLFYPL